nr:hypothetical protein [Tanacetum cinerariifolium]
MRQQLLESKLALFKDNQKLLSRIISRMVPIWFRGAKHTRIYFWLSVHCCHLVMYGLGIFWAALPVVCSAAVACCYRIMGNTNKGEGQQTDQKMWWQEELAAGAMYSGGASDLKENIESQLRIRDQAALWLLEELEKIGIM